MPVYETNLAAILRTLDDNTQIVEALFFPEVSRYGDDPVKLTKAIVRNAARILEAENLPRLYTRSAPAETETFEITLRLEPPAKLLTWRTPVDLRLDVVRWSHSETAHIAFVPALGIEVFSTRLSDLAPSLTTETQPASALEREIRAELMRRRATVSLRDLLSLERTRAVNVIRVPCAAEIRTPKQVAVSAGVTEEKKRSVLEEVAVDLTKQKLAEAYEVDNGVRQLAEALTGKAAKSVLLVGRAGAGKTAIVHELVRRRAQFGLGATPFWSTSGARLVAGMSGYGMWQERCEALWREAIKTAAVIHFGNLVELMDTGKSEHNTQGLASFFRPRFARGQAMAILECTPEQLPLIEREDAALLRAFHQLNIEEPSAEAGRRILTRYAAGYTSYDASTIPARKRRRVSLRPSVNPGITPEGIATLDRLHRRYAGYSAYPGRPLRFLRSLLEDQATDHAPTPPLGAREVTATFAKETGLPLFLLDDTVAFEAAHAHEWFSERVIGQPAAVELIIDLLATVKAGLTRQRRPIASLLFIGPTGVGKTEMAKSLAKFFFADEGRMARFDMSEYADALAVTRLVGGATGGEGTLTARIREQPFSVLLFDEFEKAHHSFFDLLLQALGEGRLTDGRGRLADFTNSIIVMTSNLGAERFRRSRPGFRDDATPDGANPDDKENGTTGQRDEERRARAAQKHFTRAVQDFLRPEMFNRIDHIVPFMPLDRRTVERIAEREMALLRQRDGINLRGVSLHVEREATRWLARRGYNARYGARPLKHLVERELLLPLAIELNRYPPARKHATVTLAVSISVEAGRLRVAVEEREADRMGDIRSAPVREETSFAAHAARLSEMRRRLQRLERSSAVTELRNTIWRLTEVERRLARAAARAKITQSEAAARHAWQHRAESVALARLPEYRRLADALKQLGEKTAAAEDAALLLLYGREATSSIEAASAYQQLDEERRVLLWQLLDFRHTSPHRITLAVFSENQPCLFDLARGYYGATRAGELEVTLAYYTADLPPELKDASESAGGHPEGRRTSSMTKHGKTEESLSTAAAESSTSTSGAGDKELKILEMFGRKVMRKAAERPAQFLAQAPAATTAIIFGIKGQSAYAVYEAERGLHTFIEGKATHHLLVHTSDANFEEYLPPPSLERRGAISPASHGERRRTYNRTEGYIEDRLLDERRAWNGAQAEGERGLAATLRIFMDEQLARAAEGLIEE